MTVEEAFNKGLYYYVYEGQSTSGGGLRKKDLFDGYEGIDGNDSIAIDDIVDVWGMPTKVYYFERAENFFL